MTIDLEKLTALPLVQAAIRAQAEAAEAKSLTTRLSTLDAHEQATAELADLASQAADLDAMQDELNHQRDVLARQRTAHDMKRQQIEAKQREQTRELRRNHGGELASVIARILGSRADSLRHEVAYLRSLRERKPHWWNGGPIEKPSPEAMRKADELEYRAGQIEQERDAILALQLARVSPQAIERDIQARVKALGFNLNTTTEQAGWRVEGWRESKAKAA